MSNEIRRLDFLSTKGESVICQVSADVSVEVNAFVHYGEPAFLITLRGPTENIEYDATWFKLHAPEST